MPWQSRWHLGLAMPGQLVVLEWQGRLDRFGGFVYLMMMVMMMVMIMMMMVMMMVMMMLLMMMMMVVMVMMMLLVVMMMMMMMMMMMVMVMVMVLVMMVLVMIVMMVMMMMMVMMVVVVVMVVVLMVAIFYSFVITMPTILHLRKTWRGWYSNCWFERISWSHRRRFRKTMRSWKFMSTSLQINPCAGRESTTVTFSFIPAATTPSDAGFSDEYFWWYLWRHELCLSFGCHSMSDKGGWGKLFYYQRVVCHDTPTIANAYCGVFFGGAEKSNSRTFYSIILTLNQQNWFTGKANNRRFSKIWFR